MKKKSLIFSALLTISISLFSCNGGGGGGNSNGSSSGGSSSSQNYIPYRASLHLVDPDNPSSPILITNKSLKFTTVRVKIDGYKQTNREYQNLHMSEVFYIDDVGKVFKLNITKGATKPSPIQVSNLNNACLLSKQEIYNALDEKSYFLVITSGADGTCFTSDDETVLINSEMTSSDNPIQLTSSGKELLFSIGDEPSSNSVNGFIIYNSTSKSIEKCDTNLSNCSTLLTLTSSSPTVKVFSINPVRYLCINDSNTQGNERLYFFDGTDIRDTGTSCYNYRSNRADDTAIYAVFKDNTGETLKKLKYSDNNWVDLYKPISPSASLFIHFLTSNYAIGYEDVNGNSKLLAIRKDGSVVKQLNSLKGFIPYADANGVYFTDYDANTKVSKACIWKEDYNSPICKNNGYIVGFSIKQNGKLEHFLSSYSNIFNRSMFIATTTNKILYVENTTSYMCGGVLKAFDPITETSTVIGNIPDNFCGLSGSGLGDKILLTGKNKDTNKSDVFFVDLTKENSLQNITNTPSKNEYTFSF